MYPPIPTGSRVLAIGTTLLVAIVVVGCGSAVQDVTATHATTTGTASPTSEAGVDSASPEPTASAVADDGVAGDELDSAAKRLADVGSYRFSIRFSGQNSGTAGYPSSMTMEGTVITEPERALEFSMLDDSGPESSGLRYIVIGDEAWMDLGDGGVMPLSADDADALFEAYSPESLFGQSYVGYVDGMNAVGTEQKNGVDTIHYTADESTLGVVSAMYGGVGLDWAMDAWVASDGGYLVSAVMGGEVSGAEGGSYEVSIDVFDIDSPSNVVTRPAT